MSKINKQFLVFKDRASFESKLANEEIKDTSIAFIAKERLIWAHGILFGDQGTHAKGYFTSVDKLPIGGEGDWAIVNEDGTWYLYYYEEGQWKKGEPYESDDYVLKANLLDYIKNFYDNIYVRRDEVYTPDQFGNGEGEENTNSGSGTAGGIFTVDTALNKDSFNPVANYVIYNALMSKLEKSDLDDYMTFEAFEQATLNWLSEDINLENYYTKEEVNDLVTLLPTFDLEVVDEKPQNPSPTTMYIIKEEGDLYKTWIYRDKWVCLGQQKIEVDLAGYVTTTSLNAKLANKQDKLVSGVNIKSINLNGETKSLLGGGTITIDLTDYATKEYVDQHAPSTPVVDEETGQVVDLSGYALKTDIPDLSNNVTTDNIDEYISTFVTQDTVEQIIHDLSTFRIEIIRDGETVENPEENVMYLIYDPEKEVYVQNVYKDDQWYSLGDQTIDIDLSGYIRESDLSPYATIAQLGTVLESYYTKSQSDSRFVNKEDIYTILSNTEQPNTTQVDQAGYDPHTGGSGGGLIYNGPKHIILEQAEYESLTTYEDNALYFVLEPQEQTNWTFGGTFPIRFGSNGVGTFPITLT